MGRPVEGEPDPLVDVTRGGCRPATAGLVVVEGETPSGAPVVVSHSPEPALRTVAVLDAVINNSDRKGGHLLRDGAIVRGCDHGVSLGVAPKLRTVLWGWAGRAAAGRRTSRGWRRFSTPSTTGSADELATLLTRGRGRARCAPARRRLLRTRPIRCRNRAGRRSRGRPCDRRVSHRRVTR